MWLDFIWLEIWAWVKVFATRRTDTKKTVMWLANTGLEKFHGLKYLPHEALLKKIQSCGWIVYAIICDLV